MFFKSLSPSVWPSFKRLLLIALSAITAASVFKLFFIQFYIVPTPSMEPTIPVGNGIFISKIQYGPRINDYILPGYSKIKRNDIVVFVSPINNNEFLIKKCIGLPGEVIRIKHNKVFINDMQIQEHNHAYLSYFIKAKNHLIFNTLKQRYLPLIKQSSDPYLVLTLNETEASNLKRNIGIEMMRPMEITVGDYQIFPMDLNRGWNRDNFGPILIPQRGIKVHLDANNIMLYKKIIEESEDNTVSIKDQQIYINGKLVNSFEFKKDYFFMMGDNRHNSNDSRYWGFVAEDKVIGKAIYKVRLGRSPFSANQSFISKLY